MLNKINTAYLSDVLFSKPAYLSEGIVGGMVKIEFYIGSYSGIDRRLLTYNLSRFDLHNKTRPEEVEPESQKRKNCRMKIPSPRNQRQAPPPPGLPEE